MVPLHGFVLFRTGSACGCGGGGKPAPVDTAGISVVGLRFAAVLIAGVLCGIAGAYLATALNAGFVKDMSAGRGFIALEALIFAKWRPWYALSACLLFASSTGRQPLQETSKLGEIVVPVQFMQALPTYLVSQTCWRALSQGVPPRAGGEPYVKGTLRISA